MDNVVSGLALLILGLLSFLSGMSAKAWRREGPRYRIGAIIVGLLFMVMGTLALAGYIEIKE